MPRAARPGCPPLCGVASRRSASQSAVAGLRYTAREKPSFSHPLKIFRAFERSFGLEFLDARNPAARAHISTHKHPRPPHRTQHGANCLSGAGEHPEFGHIPPRA